MKYTHRMEVDLADEKPVSVFDRDDPRSLWSMAPNSIKKAIETLPAKWWNATEKQLDNWCKPTPTIERLRISLWNEYANAQDQGIRMKTENIIKQVCSSEFFYRTAMGVESNVAYILKPPPGYAIQVEEMLNLGLRKLREVLALPIKDEKGKPNTRLIGEMVKVVVLLDNRHKGAVTQKMQIEQKNLNVNVNTQTPQIRKVDEIDDEIKALEREIHQLESSKPSLKEQLESGREVVIPVEATEVKETSGAETADTAGE